jgi:hypothetical protein
MWKKLPEKELSEDEAMIGDEGKDGRKKVGETEGRRVED